MPGCNEVFGQPCADAGLHRLWSSQRRRSRQVFFQETMMRFQMPGRPKRAHARALNEQQRPVAPGQICRMMGHLDAKRIAKPQQLPAGACDELVARPVEVVLFDATTLAVCRQELRRVAHQGLQQGGQAQPPTGGAVCADGGERVAAGLPGAPGVHRRGPAPSRRRCRGCATPARGPAKRGGGRCRHAQPRQLGRDRRAQARAHRRRAPALAAQGPARPGVRPDAARSRGQPGMPAPRHHRRGRPADRGSRSEARAGTRACASRASPRPRPPSRKATSDANASCAWRGERPSRTGMRSSRMPNSTACTGSGPACSRPMQG